MAKNETGPLELLSSDPHDPRKTLTGSYRKAAHQSTGAEPLYSKVLLDIERVPGKVNLRVELVRWSTAFPPIVKVVVVSLDHDGTWFTLPKSAEIRMSEAKAVAVAIARAFTEYGVTP
jgi:hypothetical protein